MKQFLFTAYFFLITATQAFADVGEKSDQTVEKIERIEVLNSGEDTSLNTYLIDQQALLETANSLSSVLASLPSVQIRQVAGLGNPIAISIRGSTSQQVNLRIDGQLINTGQFGGFDLDQIPLALIESIEVSQYQSTSTGVTPIGGEIRINTIKGDGSNASLSATLGSWQTQEINLKGNLLYKQHQLSMSVNHQQTDNDYEYLVPQSFNNSQESITEPLRNNHFRKTTYFLSDEFSSSNTTTSINAQYNEQLKAIPNYQNNSPEMASTLENTNYRVGFEHATIQPFDLWQLDYAVNLEAYWFNQQETYTDRPKASKNDIYQYDTDQFYVQFSAPTKFNTLKVTPYININNQTFVSDSWVNQQRPACNNFQSCDVEATQRLMNLGSRLNWPGKSAIQYSLLWNFLNAKNTNDARYQPDTKSLNSSYSHHSAEFDVSYRFNHHRISAHIAKGIRTPTLSELFGDRGSFKGNEDLKAELANSISLNWLARWQNINIQNTLYAQQVDNSIVAIFNSSGIGSYTNVASSTLFGLSTQLDIAVTPNFKLIATIDLIDSNTQSDIHVFDNKKLPGIYHQQYQVQAQYSFNQTWYLSLQTRIENDLYFDRANKVSSHSGFPTDNNTTQLQLSWHHAKYSASLAINNIFNQSYYDLANRPAAGRNINFKFTLKEF